MELAATYAYEVYKQKSFSAAAKVLYVSQPSISAAIGRLEKDLGIRIFDRTQQPLGLTPQGQIYIETLEKILENESNMRRRLRELSEPSGGTINVGGSCHASYHLLTLICREYYRKYPDVRVNLDIGNIGGSSILRDKLGNGELDLIISYAGEQTGFLCQPLAQERLVIAMHTDMPGAQALRHLALTHEQVITGAYPAEKELEDFSVFKDIPFLRYSHDADVSVRMNRLLGEYKSAPYSIQNARHSEIHYNMMCAGIGAVVTSTLTIVQKLGNAEDILFFMPKSPDSYRNVNILRTHLSDGNRLVAGFIETARRVCSAISACRRG